MRRTLLLCEAEHQEDMKAFLGPKLFARAQKLGVERYSNSFGSPQAGDSSSVSSAQTAAQEEDAQTLEDLAAPVSSTTANKVLNNNANRVGGRTASNNSLRRGSGSSLAVVGNKMVGAEPNKKRPTPAGGSSQR